MQSHDEGPRSDVVGKPGEADEDDGGHVVDDLLLEVLQERGSSRALVPDSAPAMPCSSRSLSVPHCPQLHPKHPETGGDPVHHRTPRRLLGFMAQPLDPPFV